MKNSCLKYEGLNKILNLVFTKSQKILKNKQRLLENIKLTLNTSVEESCVHSYKIKPEHGLDRFVVKDKWKDHTQCNRDLLRFAYAILF